jgi:uncharacterized membrane protein
MAFLKIRDVTQIKLLKLCFFCYSILKDKGYCNYNYTIVELNLFFVTFSIFKFDS